MLVSVIIPAYNAERFIEEALYSVLGQTHKEIELIVVDDGSSDHTVDIIKKVRSRDPRVTLYREINQGASVARNLGIEKSGGQLVSFLDADDIWHPTKVQKQHDLLLRSPLDVGLVYAYSRMIDTEGYVRGFTGARTHVRGHAFNRLLTDNFVSNGSTAMVRREFLPKPYAFDPDQKGNNDTYFYLRVAAQCKVDVVPEFLIGYRWNTGQNCSANIEKQISSHREMIRKICRQYPQTPAIFIRWSQAGFYLSHAQTFFKKGHYKQAALFFLKAMKTPTYIFSPLFRHLICVTLKWAHRKAFRMKVENRLFVDMDPAA